MNAFELTYVCACYVAQVSVWFLCEHMCENQAVMSYAGQQKDIIVSGAPRGV